MIFDLTYMKFAHLMSLHSKAVRAQVGAVIITKTGVLIPSYNGTARLTVNVCEDENGVTKIEVIHAELNCIIKAAAEGISIIGSTIYTTMSPCKHCAALIIQSGIIRVVYDTLYRDNTSIKYLLDSGINVDQIEKNISILRTISVGQSD